MTKQEKLLLIDCLRMSYICDPQECGHERDDENGWCKNCNDHYDALEYATECIEKQIPKKPIHKHKNYYCPTCKDDTWILWDDAIPNEVDNFCPICGQAIDWSDNE